MSPPRKLSRPQPLKLGLLWVRPVLLLVACAAVLLLPQPGVAPRILAAADWALLAAAALVGMAGGWQLGRTMAIEVHPEKGTLMVRNSPMGLLVLVALVVLRVGLRTGVKIKATAWHLDAALIVDALIVFTAALFTVRSLEMFLRARRIMGARGVVLPPQ